MRNGGKLFLPSKINLSVQTKCNIEKKYEEGSTLSEIAELYDLSVYKVRQTLKQRDVERRSAASYKKDRWREVISQDARDLICRLYTEEKLPITNIEGRTAYGTYHIRKVLKSRGVDIRSQGYQSRALNKQEEKRLCKLYQDKFNSLVKLAGHFEISIKTAANYLDKNGVDRDCRRGKIINDEAFKYITRPSSYWAGFLAADGNVYCHENANHPRISLGLQMRDTSQLYKFQNFLNTNYPVVVNPDYEAGKTTVFAFYSEKIAKHLKSRFGIEPNKTRKGVAVPARLKGNRHFFRGLIDGDGSVISHSDKSPEVRLSTGRNLTMSFVNFVKERLEKDIKASPRPASDGDFWRFGIAGRQASVVIKKLYQKVPCDLALKRKYEAAKKVIG